MSIRVESAPTGEPPVTNSPESSGHDWPAILHRHFADRYSTGPRCIQVTDE